MTIIVRSSQDESVEAQTSADASDETEQSAPGAEEASEQEEAEESGTAAEEQEEEESSEEESEESSEEGEEESEEEPPRPRKKKGGFQRRIEKLNRQKSDAERERDYWREQALKSAQKPGESDDGQDKPEDELPPAAEKKPDPDDYDTQDEYLEALTDWKVEQREQKREKEAEKKRLESEQSKVVSAYQERMNAFAETVDDFDEVIAEADEEGVKVSPFLEHLILQSAKGPQVLYELAKNPAEIDRLNGLNSVSLHREFFKLEDGLSAPSEPARKKVKKKTSKAPDPITPVGTNSDKGTQKRLDDPEISQSEYEAIRREQIRKRRAG